MKTFNSAFYVLLSAVLFSCSAPEVEEPAVPLALSGEKMILSYHDGEGQNIEIQADTLLILSGNGDYKLTRRPWFTTTGEVAHPEFEKYIEVFIKDDMIIARRTGLPIEMGMITNYRITDARGEEAWFQVSDVFFY